MVVLAFLWAAAEWTAWRLGFQPQLGPAWFMIGSWRIYQPLAFFVWGFKFDAYAPKLQCMRSDYLLDRSHLVRIANAGANLRSRVPDLSAVLWQSRQLH